MAETIVDDVPMQLAPGHDVKLYAQVFKRSGRIHIPDLLTREAAARAQRCLEKETEWSLVLNDGDKVFDMPAEAQAAMTPEQRIVFIDRINASAQRRFQFLFDNHRLSEVGEPYRNPNHYLARIVAFLNSVPFLTFVRTVTGFESIAFADAQATLYRGGHFLTQHDDAVAGKKRKAAFVLNLTAKWKADWGGILQFLDDEGHVAEGFTPSFNALNILRVPQPHLVSLVAPFAGAGRYSVTGWLRER